MSSILIGDVLERTTVLYGDRTALLDGEIRYTYREAYERVRRLAAGLLKLGLQPCSHIGILANNCHHYWESYFAAHYAGMPLVPLNTRLSARELEFVMKDAEIRALIAGVEYLEILERFRPNLPGLQHVIVLADRSPQGMHSYESILGSAKALPAPARDWRENDMINLCYTGGTTARPKGVMLSPRNVISNAQHCLMNFGYAETDRWLHAAPMFHLADAWACYVFTMVGGAHVFIPGFQPELFMETVRRERVTATILVPTMLNFVVNHPKVRDQDFSSLRLVLFGASPISTDRILAAKEAFGPILVQAYGMTETAPLLTSQKPEWLDYESAEGIGRLASCGREVVGVRVRVVNSDGTEAGPDGVGEVVARGPNVMLGYWKRPEETQEALRDGWMHTGDIGRMDGDGFLYIIDQAKDMIISGGENIFSTEVESALYEHPAVLEAAVIGIPDAKWGEAVHAVVVLRGSASATEDELIRHCHSLIAGYKCPKGVSFSENPLPKSGPGKILKTQLREPYWRGRERRIN